MVQRGQGLGFTLEAREPIGVMRERLGQDLDGDVSIARARLLLNGDLATGPANAGWSRPRRQVTRSRSALRA